MSRDLTIGIDMGGTFVDCVAIPSVGPALSAKEPTTPGDPVTGILAAIDAAARAGGLDAATALGRASRIVHGTTLGLNALIAGDVGRVALLATRGHEDAILIGRVHQKVAGLRPHELTRVSELRKPEPLVPRWMIHGIHERIDARGQVLVRLDEPGVLSAAQAAVDAGCDAIAVAFLWSFLEPAHERRAAALIGAAHPGLPVVLSSDVAPVLGEYERTAATIVSAALRAPFSGYLERLSDRLTSAGFGGRLWIMGMTGGALPVEDAARRPVEALRSGPVGGIVAARQIAADLGASDVIATDMGGTSFDVGVIVDGEPHLADVTVAARLHLATPGIEVRSIGAGGGSIAWVDDLRGLHVGPRSAGAHPGPACYGRGGTDATVTDADVVLGRLDPEAVLGGQIRLDAKAARTAVERVADRLGVDVVAAAAGIVRVADAQMADLVRAVTIEQGRDPRGMLLIAYGGAGPLHVGRYGPDVGVREAIVPSSASVLSALGLAVADYRRTYRRSRRLTVPLDPGVVEPLVEELRAEAVAEHEASGVSSPLQVRSWVDLRYRRQTHHLRIPMEDIEAVGRSFEERYAALFGAGTGYAASGIEATAVGIDAIAATDAVFAPPRPAAAGRRPARSRPVWFDAWVPETPVHSADALEPGEVVTGPAILEWPTTTLALHPGQVAAMDALGHVRIALVAEAS